jgi:transcriptional regulator with XRE-family HTH domain
LRVARDSDGRRDRQFKRPKDELANESRVIGARLRAARQAAELSQREVAAKLGENQSWVSKVEQGERRADLAEGRRLMILYRVEPNAILMPEGFPRGRPKLTLVKDAVGAGRAADKPGRARRGKVIRPSYRGPGPRRARKTQSKKSKG